MSPIPNKGWVAAGSLCAGDVLLLQNGNYTIIERIQYRSLETPIKVFNFEVADFHTYYVGKSAVLVHNTCQKFTADQQAVIELAREHKAGLSQGEAEILVDLAREYGISNHGPMIHPNRSGIWGFTEHIKIFNEHIPVK